MASFLDKAGLAYFWSKVKESIEAKADPSDIPTNTSQLNNDSGFLTEHQDISGKLDKAGDGSSVTTSFTQSGTRSNISSGETLKNSMSKISKWFADLGSLAFSSSVSKSDLASDVQVSLGKADTAIQSLDGYATQAYVDGIEAVSYGTAQTLTDEQQAQARGNMDAQQRPFTYELGDPVAENVEIAAGETYTISTPVDLIKNDQYFLSLCDASDVRYDILGTAYPYTVNDSAITVRWLDGYVVYDGTHIENHYPWAIHDVTIQKVLSWSLAPSEQILSLEGKETSASGLYAHAEGANTIASGSRSHSEGSNSVASGNRSHAEGNSTIAASNEQHVQGKYNVADAGKTYAHIVGNGTADAARSNAHTIDWSGNAWYAGDVYVGGTGQNDAAAKKLGVETMYIQAYTSNSTWTLNGGYTYDDVKALIDDNHPPIIYIKFSDNSRRDYHYDYINSSGTIYFIAPYGNYLYVYTIKSDGSMSSVYYSLVTTSRTVNGHALSANITLTSDDVKAVSYDTAQTLSDEQKGQARENIGAQATLTFDSAPTADSTNPVTSGGVYTALTNYTETDPTVPDWAKAETKPSYTASEVGAISIELKDHYDAAYAHSQASHAPFDAEKNVQSDWTEADSSSDAYIKNKPDVATKADLNAITPESIGAKPADDSDIFIAAYGTSTNDEIHTAIEAGKMVTCLYQNVYIPLAGEESATEHTFSISTPKTCLIARCVNNVWSNESASYPVSAHASTHAAGGSDPIAPADIGAIAASMKGAASGVAELGADGKVPIAQLPDVTSIKEQNNQADQKFWKGTKAEYDALDVKSQDTLYIVTDEDEGEAELVGDMHAYTYDPQHKEQDIFAYADTKQSPFTVITIPKGRMRGDVDGDGSITYADSDLLMKISSGNATTDDAGRWCAYVTGESYISSTCALHIQKYVGGDSSYLTSTPTFADYYENWSYVKVDDLSGYWITDITVDGLSASNNVAINIDGPWDNGMFYQADVMSGVLRIYSSKPPIDDVSASLLIAGGNGQAVICVNAHQYHAGTHQYNGLDPMTPEMILAAKSVVTTIPKGRVRGDVDGDGRVTFNDMQEILNHTAKISTITDEVQLWCAETTGNETLDVSDAMAISNFLSGNGGALTSKPTFADYYGNWTYVQDDAKSGHWYTDIEVDSVGEMVTGVIVSIDGQYPADMFYKAEPKFRKVRIYSKYPPISDVKCVIHYGFMEDGYGYGSSSICVNREDPIFVATYGTTTIAEMEYAYYTGKSIFVNAGGDRIPLTFRDGANHTYTFQSEYSDEILQAICKNDTWSSKHLPYQQKFVAVTLAASGWDSTAKTQTVAATGVKASETAQMIIPTPAMASQTAYYAAGILCTAQAADSLTFTAKNIPTDDLTVYVVMQALLSEDSGE